MKFWESYQEILLQEFSQRKTLDPQYSLRRFSGDLGLAPSRISEIFKDQQGLSNQWGVKIAEKCNFTEKKKEIFLTLIEKQSARSDAARKAAVRRLEQLKNQYIELLEDAHFYLSEWYHFPILECLHCSMSETPGKISRRLGIDESLVVESLQRMVRLGLLEKTPQSQNYTVRGNFRIQPNMPAESLKLCHLQILDKGKMALDLWSTHEREFGMNFLSFDETEMTSAKQDIREFLAEFGRKYSKRKRSSKSYVLALQFFNLEKPKRNKVKMDRK